MHLSRTTTSARRRLGAIVSIASVCSIGFGVAAPLASADHSEEKVTVSKADGLTDGESVKVTFSGFKAGGDQAKVVIAGQGKLVTIPDKLNFDEYAVAPAVDVAADGTGSFDFIVTSDHGTVKDGTTLNCMVQQCWIVVVQTPFLPQPNYNSVPITFAGSTLSTTTTVAAAASTTTVTTAQTTVSSTVATTTTTTAAPAATTTTVKAASTSGSGESTSKNDDEEGGSGALYAIIAAVVVALGAGGFFIARRKPPVS